MQYMLLIHEDEETYRGPGGAAAMEAIIPQHGRFAGELQEAGVLRGGGGLQPVDTARTLRRKGGAYHVVDGPYAETKEQLGGFYMIDVPDMEAALAWARKLPLHADGSVEVRPVIDTGGAG